MNKLNKYIPDFIDGIKSVFDLSGRSILDPMEKYLNKSDEEITSDDWESIGNDLYNIIDSHIS